MLENVKVVFDFNSNHNILVMYKNFAVGCVLIMSRLLIYNLAERNKLSNHVVVKLINENSYGT